MATPVLYRVAESVPIVDLKPPLKDGNRRISSDRGSHLGAVLFPASHETASLPTKRARPKPRHVSMHATGSTAKLKVLACVASLGEALLEVIDESKQRDAEWLDQNASPLGRRKHLELARDGVLPSRKDGRQVLIRAREIDAYLESRPSAVRRAATDDDVDEVSAIVAQIVAPAKLRGVK